MIDLSRKRFGRWTVKELAGKNERGSSLWRCICRCGQVKVVRDQSLKTGQSKSCGCLKRELLPKQMRKRIKHGENRVSKRTPEYQTWANIKQRCYNPNLWSYHRYGGRGIIMFEPWRISAQAYIQWLVANIGRRPSKLYSIDRINNDGNYEPGNLRWSKQKAQLQNRTHKGDFH